MCWPSREVHKLDRLIRNYDRCLQGLVEPQLARLGIDYPDWITVDSPEWQREACVQIRRYQSRECKDGMSMDTSFACWLNVEVRVFKDRFYDKSDRCREGIIGAVGFEKNVLFDDGKKRHILQFCWIHPFYRREGLLKQAWPEFLKKFGSFLVSTPRSPSMVRILQKVGYEDPS